MDNNFLSGGIAELELAKQAIAESARLQAEVDAATANASAKEKDLEAQRKYVNDKINSTTKDRRNQLKKTHDEQVDQATKELKEVEKKRKEAKSDAVQVRITNETSTLVDHMDQLKKQNKILFRENSVPGFCNTKFYYALYAPKTPMDFLILVITVLIAFGAIPNIVCALLNTDKVIVKVLVYLAIVVFFVLIYFLFFLISKRNSKGEVLEQARPVRKAIHEEKKQIKKMSKSIVKDSDESGYGLEGLDAEISQRQQAVNETMQRRDDALSAFDQQTAVEIREQIMKENQGALEQLEAEVRSSNEALEAAKNNAKLASDRVTSEYEVYLGKKNTSPEKIDSLINLIKDGKANTVMEALDLQNGEIKK